MQKSKKLLSLILVMAMMVSMSVNCFAEPVGPGESPATFTKIVESPNEHTVPVNLAVEAATFNVTVPTELPITIDANGVDIAASNAKITNNGKGPVSIKSIAVAPTSGWSIVPINTDFSKVPADTKQIGLNMFGIEVPANGAFPVDSFKQIDGGTNLALPYDSKVATQKTGITNTPVNVLFTFGWEELTVSEVTISQKTASINKGESLQLTSTTKYREAPVWSSSDDTIATVDATGLVTAKDWGTATITVSVGGFSATCVVTVPKIINGIDISQTTASINKGSTLQLSSTTKYRETPVWSSSDNTIATVDITGLVTAKDWGTATITVSVGGFSATCVVTVPKIINGIDISQTTASINKGSTLQLSSTTKYRETPVWSSSNDAIATINQSGLVTAKDWGTATITVSVGGFSATCTVTVPKILNGITISQAAATINKGNNLQLTSNTIYRGAPVWSSSNDAVATVDQTGLVTARDWGTATITVSVGGFSATCNITVPKIVSGITLNQTTANMKTQETLQLTADVKYRSTVTWSSSDSSVATVSNTGLVSALKAGSTTVKASIGGMEANCVVTVTPAGPPAVGAAYDDGTYKYTYGGEFGWDGVATPVVGQNGWGVQLKDRTSTAPVIKAPLSSIQGYPVTNMSGMFETSQATSIDLSGFDTSNVTDMNGMFSDSAATTLNLPEGFGSNATNMNSMFNGSRASTLNFPAGFGSKATNMRWMFDSSAASTLNFPAGFGSKATDMKSMFYYSAASTLNLPEGFGSKATDMNGMFYNSLANTLTFPAGFGSNATNMNYMFRGSAATTLNLPAGFGSNATEISYMFRNSAATKGYAATQAEADKWNNSTATTSKPATLTFTVKP